MSDLQYIPSTKSLQDAVKKLKLANPVKDISLATGVNKGSVSSYLNGNIKPSIPFIKKFEEVYKIKIEFVQTNDKQEESFKPTISENKGSPYYDVDFVGGFDLVVNNQSVNPSFYIDFLPYNDCDCWVNVTGKSMSPFISHGDIVALKKVENWREFLLFGEIYAIVTSEFRTIKIVGKSELIDHFKLIPYSKSHEFSEQDLPIKLIDYVYRVKGCLKKFF